MLDVGLAGEVNGLDLARLADQASIPVLFVTGACPDGARSVAYGCLNKPYSPLDLVAAIDAIDAIVQGRSPGNLPAGLTLFRSEAGRSA